MLQFNKELDYAIQLLLHLLNLKKRELLSLRKFSEGSKISFLFLQRIAKKLRAAKIIEAVKGAHGGYYLAVDPKKITLKNVIEAVEGDYALTGCLKAGCHCVREKECLAKPVFKNINQQMISYLNSQSLASLQKYV